MTKVLVTGATGNVGYEVLLALHNINHHLDLYAAVRNVELDKEKLLHFNIKFVKFDFVKIETYTPALEGIDILFLLRPPQIAQVNKYFKPLITKAMQASVKHIIFISVQGVEKSKIIPHHKIEKVIRNSAISFTFLRAAYFMQNFTSTLKFDLVHKHRIYLPAGQAQFTLIDVYDLAAVVKSIMINPVNHINKCYELTNNEILTFTVIAKKISIGTRKTITYVSPNLFQFFITKIKEGMPVTLILVIIMLHYFPRFQKTPKTTGWVKGITGMEPKSFDEFIFTNTKDLQ